MVTEILRDRRTDGRTDRQTDIVLLCIIDKMQHTVIQFRLAYTPLLETRKGSSTLYFTFNFKKEKKIGRGGEVQRRFLLSGWRSSPKILWIFYKWFTVKRNHIGSAVSENLRSTHAKRQTYYYFYIILIISNLVTLCIIVKRML